MCVGVVGTGIDLSHRVHVRWYTDSVCVCVGGRGVISITPITGSMLNGMLIVCVCGGGDLFHRDHVEWCADSVGVGVGGV